MTGLWWLLAVPVALVVDWLLASPGRDFRLYRSWGEELARRRSEGYRPKPTGCYRATRSVNPNTVVPPRSPSAVRPAPNPTRPYTYRG